MLLKAKMLEIEAKRPIVMLNEEDAREIDVRPSDRVEVAFGRNRLVAIVNTAEKFIKPGEIGLYEWVSDRLKVRRGSGVEVKPAEPPESLRFIRNRLQGKVLKPREIDVIIDDVVSNRLSEIEITGFVASLYSKGMTIEEAAAMSVSMASKGGNLNLGKREIYDKHSLGGVPGDKTTILLVPIVAAAGLTIPKTSSRAITSPAGTADRVGCLCPVELSLDEIKRVVRRTSGCMVWGGAVDLAPADDAFINIEYPLSIDPLLLPSVMSKKKSVNADYVVIDMPTGRGTKISTKKDAEELASKFIELGRRLDIKVNCASTFGEQPVGYAVGPALEAREALENLMLRRGSRDLIDKVSHLAGMLLGFKRGRDESRKALHILKSGKAEAKLREIIEAQGGNPKVRPEDLAVGTETVDFKSKRPGRVLWISNRSIDVIAKEAGAPKDKGAGVLLNKKVGDSVSRGEVIFTLHADRKHKLNRALKLAESLEIVGVGKRLGMLLSRIPFRGNHEKSFILER